MADYKKLFTVAINHSYYTDRISPDFDIIPLAGTKTLMKDNRLLFKKDNQGFRVLYQSEEGSDQSFLPFADIDLKFAMVLKDAPGQFQNITDLNDGAQTYSAGNLIYFRNAVQTDNLLDYSLINALKPSSFTYEFPQDFPPPGGTNGVIVVENEEGTDVTPTQPDPNAVKPDAEGNFFYPIDFDQMPSGLYTFKTTIDSNPTETRTLYIDNTLVRQQIFGLIKIHIVDYQATNFPSSPERGYSASFAHRETVWRYKMVLKSGSVGPGDDLDIIDTASGGITFSPQSNEYTNGILTMVWDSDADVPYSQAPTTTFDFIKNASGSQDVVLSSLTNPPTLLVSAAGTDFGTSVIYITV